MPSRLPFDVISQTTMIEQICSTLRQNRDGQPPYTLVLGAGFSSGVIPTVKDMVQSGIPEFIHQSSESKTEYQEFLRSLWNRIQDSTAKHFKGSLLLDKKTGMN